MSEKEQEQYIKDRLLQYSSTFYPIPETPMPQQIDYGTAVETPAYNSTTEAYYPPAEPAEEVTEKKKEPSAVKAGLILLFALIISGALIIYALSRFIG